MPAVEYFGWEQHLRRWPPGDSLAQRLLATLCALVANAAFQLKKPARPHDFAPWLRTPEEEQAQRRARLARRASLVEEAYRRNHGP